MKKFWKWIRSHFWIRRVHERHSYVPPRDITIVVAGNYRQFTQWCFKNKLHPSNRNLRYIPVESTLWRTLAGQDARIKEVVYTGTWRSRPDIKELHEGLSIVVHRNKTMWDYDVTDREDPH